MYGIDLEIQEKNCNGDGLPKIGNIMDVFGPSGLHRATVKVNYVGEKLIIGVDLNNEESCFNIKVCTFKPVNQAETAKQKAIDEINGLILRAQESRGSIASIMVEEGYTKSKVKPLPKDFLDLYHNQLDNHQLSLYEWISVREYCIGSAD